MDFLVWLLSPAIVLLSFIYDMVCSSTSLLSLAKCYFSVCASVCASVCVCPSINGHLYCIHFGVILNNTAVNIHAQAFLCFPFFWLCIGGVAIAVPCEMAKLWVTVTCSVATLCSPKVPRILSHPHQPHSYDFQLTEYSPWWDTNQKSRGR